MKMHKGLRHGGFSLVELAMVLFIISLLLGGLLVPLTTQLEGRQRRDAQAQLDEIVEALIGYAIIHGKLPCYTSQADPTAADYGEEDSPCNPTGRTSDGYLPWKTLGVAAHDPWARDRTSAADSWDGYWRYRVDDNYYTSFSLSTGTATDLSVLELDTSNSSAGSPVYQGLTASTEPPVAIVYSTGKNLTQDGQNSSYEPASSDNPTYESGVPSSLDRDGDGDTADDEFDDIMVWLNRPLLYSRMVSAGRLP